MSSLYAIKDTPNKGKGMFATRDIKRGTCVVSEAPLVYVSSTNDDANKEAVSTLSKKDKKDFFSLHNIYAGEELPREHGVIAANSYPLGRDTSRGAVYRVISRINHSCAPNVSHSWNPVDQKEYVHAIKNIPADCEIMTSYIPLLMVRKERQRMLLHRFRFDCLCELCSSENNKEYDTVVIRVNECTRLTLKYASEDPRKALGFIREGLNLLDRIGGRCKTAFYYDAFQICAMFSNYDLAKEWAERHLDEYRAEIGHTGSEYGKYLSYARDPRSFLQAGYCGFVDLRGACPQ
ncbi:hypothetical protein B0O80DRAFT_499686 [Mortierella sp. GBAus27b]|nr:hypothetical protein BGX31_008335 [Mortierella sp. GBA43]KAI8352396.1 hypothetical protein B0O80DRAFT_499686 [Mortierella sp. GBAus27b]